MNKHFFFKSSSSSRETNTNNQKFTKNFALFLPLRKRLIYFLISLSSINFCFFIYTWAVFFNIIFVIYIRSIRFLQRCFNPIKLAFEIIEFVRRFTKYAIVAWMTLEFIRYFLYMFENRKNNWRSQPIQYFHVYYIFVLYYYMYIFLLN